MATGKDLHSGAPTGTSRPPYSSQSLIGLVDSRRQDSLKYNYRLFRALPAWYDMYRGVWQNRGATFRNNLSIPFTFAMIQRDVAGKVQTSFGTWPIVTFAGYSPEDEPKSKRTEVLISAQMKDCNSLMRAIDFFTQADINGTAIARYGWKKLTRRSKVVKRETVAPGLELPILHEYNATHFDGPDWYPVDRLDFWQQPGRADLDSMNWVIHRYWLDWDDMVEDAWQAEQANEEPYFNRAAVQSLKEFPLQGQQAQEFVGRRLTFRNEYEHTVRQNEKFAKPIEIWEMWGTVPDEFAPDGVRSRVVAIGNGKVVLKNIANPFWNQAKPFKHYSPVKDPYSFDAPGKVEITEKIQRTADRIQNQKLDALDLLIDPMWVMSNSVNINSQQLFTRAGKVLLVDGDATEANIRPLTPDIRGFQQAYPEIAQLWEYMQLGSGISDIGMGVAGSSRETARGVLTRQENMMTRLSLEARAAEEMFIEPLANAFVDLNRQYLPMPHQVKILGSMATVNPVTGLPYPQEPVTVDWDDLEPDYRARAVGATQMIGRNVRQQNAMGLLQMMSANPALMQLVNWANFARTVFELFDFPNVNDFLVTQVPAVNQLAQDTGQSPQAVAGAVSQPLDQLSPQVIGQLLGNQQSANPLTNLVGANGGFQ